MNFQNCCSYLVFLFLCGKGGGGLSCINLGVMPTSGISVVSLVVVFVIQEAINLGCSACSPCVLVSTKEVFVGFSCFYLDALEDFRCHYFVGSAFHTPCHFLMI